jgi:hypothetical protein
MRDHRYKPASQIRSSLAAKALLACEAAALRFDLLAFGER